MPQKTKDGRAYVRFTVELHPDFHARFRAFTDSLGRNRADVVREALEEYISRAHPAEGRRGAG